jgi:hypothetical protein
MIDSLIKNIYQEILSSQNLLYKPIVVCPNGNVRNYIILRIANNDKYKIATGVEFTTIETILKKLLIPGQKLVDESIFGLYSLLILKSHREKFVKIFSILKNHQNEISIHKRMDLAMALGSLIVRYQKELGEDWQTVIQNNSNEYKNEEILLYEEIKKLLKNKKIKNSNVDEKKAEQSLDEFVFYEDFPALVKANQNKITQPIHIIGAINPIYIHLESLKYMKSNIHFYQLFPYDSIGNKWSEPIVSILNKRLNFIIDFFKIAINPKNKSKKDKSEVTSNLEVFQSSLIDNTKDLPTFDDNSLQLIIAPSTKREIEAVHAHILTKLNIDKKLTPNDFLILVPNLAIYSNDIYSVFSKLNRINLENGGYIDKIIPFIITDEVAGKESTYMLAIKDFFNVGLSEYLNRRNILSLLRHTSIQIALGFNQEDIGVISNWFDTYNFYSELSDDEKNLDEYGENPEINRMIFSFSILLKRIRMGLFLPINNQEIFKTEDGINYLPISNLNREHLSILDKLHGALEKWENWMNFMKSNSIRLEEILNHIEINLKPNFNDFSENRSYLKLKNKLLQYNSIYNENLNGIEILKIIEDIIGDDKETKSAVLENGITISGIQPVRPIPFKNIYILGLNQGNFGVNPDKSPYDLYLESGENEGFQILKSDENAKLMLLEAILSARENLVISYVVQDSSDDINELLKFRFDSDNINYFNLKNLNNIKELEIKKIFNKLFSKTGNVLGSLLETIKESKLSIPITPIPLSKYSKFYTNKELVSNGDFIHMNSIQGILSVTYLQSSKEKNSKYNEREIFTLLFANKNIKKSYLKNIDVIQDFKKVELKKLANFIINPYEDFLDRMGAIDYDLLVDPNKENDPIEYDRKSLTKKCIPYFKEFGSNFLEKIKELLPQWKASGELPLGNWEIKNTEIIDQVEYIFRDLVENIKEDRVIYRIKDSKLYINNIENLGNTSLDTYPILLHQWEVYGEKIIMFKAYSEDNSKKYSKSELLANAMAMFFSKNSDINFSYYITHIDGDNDILKLKNLENILIINEMKKKEFFEIFQEAYLEYTSDAFPYNLENIDLKKYDGDINNLEYYFKSPSDYDPNDDYEKKQRKRQKSILGNRNPNLNITKKDKDRLIRLLNLQKELLEITGITN